jgi:stalled ribosome alternative rescue factor ArfA
MINKFAPPSFSSLSKPPHRRRASRAIFISIVHNETFRPKTPQEEQGKKWYEGKQKKKKSQLL